MVKKIPDVRWKECERQAAKFFQQYNGAVEESNPLKKLQSSSGRIGHFTSLEFDSISKDYSIEVKRSKISGTLWKFWTKISQISIQWKNNPVLVIYPNDEVEKEFIYDNKKYKLSPLHIITESRHKELLLKEQQLEEIQNLEKVNNARSN